MCIRGPPKTMRKGTENSLKRKKPEFSVFLHALNLVALLYHLLYKTPMLI